MRTYVLAARSLGRLAAAVAITLVLAAAQGFAPDPLRAQRSESPDPLFFDAFQRAGQAVTAPREAPRLVVLLVVDQMRADFVTRFAHAFGKGGLRRITDDGAVFTECTIPYAGTWTAAGHATLVTGASPWVHGVVGNSWWDQSEGRRVSSIEDARYTAVGPDEGRGASPHRLRAQTLGDVLRGATRGHGKVVTIAGKDRSAILSGGVRPTGAYWIDWNEARFQTSSYYTDRLPGWAVAANERARRDSAARAIWEPAGSADAYLGTRTARGAPTFPHRVVLEDGNRRYRPLRHTPFQLELTFDFAEEAVLGEELGRDDLPDLLVLALSVTDDLGHRYGPDSPEVLDVYARTDRRLAEFLELLDDRVGRGRYTVALTADHGAPSTGSVARMFEVSVEDSVGGIDPRELAGWCDRVLDEHFGLAPGERNGSWVVGIHDGAVTLDEGMLVNLGLSIEEVSRALADSVRHHPFLAGAYTPFDPGRAGPPSPWAEAARRSWFPGRAGHVLLITRPYAFFGRAPTLRTNHGSPYRYDVHVPLVLWGWGVDKGVFRAPVSTVDVAPTLSALLGLTAPAQCEGRPLHEALDLPKPSKRRR